MPDLHPILQTELPLVTELVSFQELDGLPSKAFACDARARLGDSKEKERNTDTVEEIHA